jgi:hypothetical protein
VPEKQRKVSNRGRKAAVAAVITSSPYKNDFVNSRQEKESKLAKAKNKKKTAKRNKRTKKIRLIVKKKTQRNRTLSNSLIQTVNLMS